MCTERYIHPFTDFGFKRLFGNEHHKEFMIDFLNSLLEDEEPIKDITYMPTEQLSRITGERNAIFDVYCTTEKGQHFIVEMQNAYQPYFADRSIFYATFPMHEIAQKGDWNFNLPRIYTVSFLNFNMPEFEDLPDAKHVVKLTDIDTKKVFSNKLTLIFLEMKKFTKDIDELENNFEKWLYVIKNMNQLDSFPDRLKSKLLERFFKAAEIFAFNASERRAYEGSLKAMRDYNNTMRAGIDEGYETGFSLGKEEGLAEGREEGRAEGRAELLRQFKEAGMSVEDIAKYTKLSVDVVEDMLR
ncbi:MAG: Rpn family recombination-promoting nuclease/putative transposase [Bacteroidales bacterium]|nr:Rpn family recombination-promoting nuclease/putative transposase [Bacteroidales bacterium]